MMRVGIERVVFFLSETFVECVTFTILSPLCSQIQQQPILSWQFSLCIVSLRREKFVSFFMRNSLQFLLLTHLSLWSLVDIGLCWLLLSLLTNTFQLLAFRSVYFQFSLYNCVYKYKYILYIHLTTRLRPCILFFTSNYCDIYELGNLSGTYILHTYYLQCYPWL